MNRKPVPIHLQPHPPTQPAEASVATPEPGPVWRRVRTIERVLSWWGVLPPHQFDDRGGKMRRFSDEHIVCVVRESEPTAKSRVLTLMGLSMLGAALAGYAFLAIRHPALTAVQTFFLAMIAIAVVRSVASNRATQLGKRAATLIESGRCGACAHLIDAASTRGVDFVRCAECGSQWNTQRFVDARAADTFVSPMLRRGSAFEDLTFTVDDRLVSRCFAKAALKTMRGAARASVPDMQRRTRLLRAKRMHAFKLAFVRSLRWSLPTFVLSVGVVVYAANVTQSTYHEVVSVALGGSAMMAAFIFGMSSIAAWSNVRSYRLRLEIGLCATCRGVLDPAAAPEFDGCVRCATCGCLWKHDVVGTARAPEQPNAAHPTSAKPNAAP